MSLRAKRSNPESLRGCTLDCFVASRLAMTEYVEPAPRHTSFGSSNATASPTPMSPSAITSA
ncbi:hypothetical protein C7G41_02015 [Bradyrhizobium sp. MOS002]|nr:hypothetical protein C7G41_02015 [Bradyrhizobium sp. MOS002]